MPNRKSLASMTSAEFKEELSIAGSPDKMMEIEEAITALIADRIDTLNLAELLNVQLVLKRKLSEMQQLEREEYKRQHPR